MHHQHLKNNYLVKVLLILLQCVRENHYSIYTVNEEISSCYTYLTLLGCRPFFVWCRRWQEFFLKTAKIKFLNKLPNYNLNVTKFCGFIFFVKKMLFAGINFRGWLISEFFTGYILIFPNCQKLNFFYLPKSKK